VDLLESREDASASAAATAAAAAATTTTTTTKEHIDRKVRSVVNLLQSGQLMNRTKLKSTVYRLHSMSQ